MDVNALLITIVADAAAISGLKPDDTEPVGRLAHGFLDLHNWLMRGGFPPQMWLGAGRGEYAHVLRIDEAQKMDADPRTFVRAVCSCGDYTSSVDSPSGATRAWLSHWQAKTRGVGKSGFPRDSHGTCHCGTRIRRSHGSARWQHVGVAQGQPHEASPEQEAGK